ncbi:hypothetical protein A9Q84_13035 [Halobacteriovorax marinus]|uniref:Uncharacterized protein n=1 Tax=Halobacteriovorax marinus TaxID=97084 RepID=A0A1Y5F8Y1_9BACT|nr:hypothetical protein A9Q84_13035 [Halobacteriovorax marinus]
MKKYLIPLIFSALFSNVQALDLGDNDLLNLPLCSDALVRLYPAKLACIEDHRPTSSFDIPELGIDFGDLYRIVLGSESSGGRIVVIGGDGTRTMTNNFPSSIDLECSAKIIVDGAKSLSFLLEQNFTLDTNHFDKTLAARDWKKYVIEGNSFYTTQRYAVPTIPRLDLTDYKVSLEHLKATKNSGAKNILSVCKNNACALVEQPASKPNFTVRLKTKKNVSRNFSFDQTIQVSCHGSEY